MPSSTNTVRRAGLSFLFVVTALTGAPLATFAAPVGPRAPTNLVATPTSGTEISLTWTDNSGIEAGFNVERAASSSGPWTTIGTAGQNIPRYTDTGLTAATTYYYRVRSFNQRGNSAYSNTASTTTAGQQTPPATPTNLSGGASSSTQITLTWTDNSNNEGNFGLYRAATTNGLPSMEIALPANTTSCTDSGLAPNTTYSYRVYAYNQAGYSAATPNVAVNTGSFTGSTVTSPRGIYMLDANVGQYRLGLLSKANLPYVDGYAWRMPWTAFASGTTTGVYNFAPIDTAIAQLQALSNNQNNRMKLTLALNVQQVPAYAMAKVIETFQALLPGSAGYATVPVPWDAGALAEYQKFTKALGDHQTYDTVSRTYKALRDHPALGQINAGIIGLQAIRDLGGNLTVHASYVRSNFVKAVVANVHALQDQFPAKPTYLAYFSMQDATRNPSLDENLIDALNDDFDGHDTAHPHIGLFQEALRGDNPEPNTSNGLANSLLMGRAGGSFIMFQACGPWLTRLFCTWLSTDLTPANGMSLGYNGYGALYYELYEVDLTYSGYTSDLTSWHNFLLTAP